MPEAHRTTRRHLGALLAPLYGPEWPEHLRAAIGWRESTVRRLGLDRMPLDARRLRLMAELLRKRNAADPKIEKIAAGCERRADLADAGDQGAKA